MERIQRKALNLQSYSNDSGFNEKGLIADVAALATEVGADRNTEERVHMTLEAKIKEHVVNFTVNKNRDVREMFEYNSPESIAGKKIADVLLNDPEGSLFAWLSPKDGMYDYDEARIRVGVVKMKMGFRILESYGIPVDFESQKMIDIFYRLQEFSDKEAQVPTVPDDLRDKIVVFKPADEKQNWLDFLGKKEVLPELETVWEAVKNGKVAEFNRKARKEARKEVQRVLKENKIDTQLSENRAIKIGAQIERGMIGLGWNMTSKICGMLNSDMMIVGILNGGISISLAKNWVWTIGNCIVESCRRVNVKVGPCKVCEVCQAKYDMAQSPM